MKKQEIKELLVKEYVGKKFASYGSESANAYQIMAHLRYVLGLENSQKFYVREKSQSAQLLYVDYVANKRIERSIAQIDVKKQKGKYISSYWGIGSYEWTIKDIEVTICDNGVGLDIEDVIKSVMEDAQIQARKNREYQDVALEVLKGIQKICKENNTDLYSMIRYIKDNHYSLEELIEKENR